MWDRVELKRLAKNSLKDSYWTGVLIVLILMAIESGASSVAVAIPFGPIAVAIFLTAVIQVGVYRWFMRTRETGHKQPIDLIFSLFNRESFAKTAGAMAWMMLFLFLWSLFLIIPLILFILLFVIQAVVVSNYSPDTVYASLTYWPYVLIGISAILFSIPVIIKTYSYRLTPWILSDNPGIGYQRALKLSMALTHKQKWRMFVLDLSFLGWWILGALALGIGTLFVYPYYYATITELYAALRKNGVDNGLCTMEELGYYPT